MPISYIDLKECAKSKGLTIPQLITKAIEDELLQWTLLGKPGNEKPVVLEALPFETTSGVTIQATNESGFLKIVEPELYVSDHPKVYNKKKAKRKHANRRYVPKEG